MDTGDDDAVGDLVKYVMEDFYPEACKDIRGTE